MKITDKKRLDFLLSNLTHTTILNHLGQKGVTLSMIFFDRKQIDSAMMIEDKAKSRAAAIPN